MPTHTYSHRWILALPVVLAMVCLTVREGMLRAPTADVLHGPATRIQADAGADYSETDGVVDLRSGNLLLDAPGLATVHANGWDVRVWGGSMYVSSRQDALTIAALDVPVVVQSGERGIAVVVPGRQWRAPNTALPDAKTDPAAWQNGIVTQPLPANFLEEQTDIVGGWRAERPAVPVPSDDLALRALESKPTRALMAEIRLRSDLRLYGLLQPSVRDGAWAYLPQNAAPDASTWIALLMLPQLERSDVTASPLTVRLWGETLAAAFTASADPDAACSAVLPLLEKDILAIAEGYPLRALRFAEAARNSVGTGALLTPAAASALEHLQTMTAESLRADALSVLPGVPTTPLTASVAAPAPSAVVADPALEARARDVLERKGGMFTRDSVIKTVAEGMVDVRGVVFGLPSGDKAPHFVFNPDTGAARAIIDGTVQPYDVPFDAYLEWESGR